MVGEGGCGCGAPSGEPCRCEDPDRIVAEPPPSAPAPPPLRFAAARGPLSVPGTPQAYTRFDLFEESRRRDFAVAFPADPARPPPEPRHIPSIVRPDAHPGANGRAVIEPRFDAPARKAIAHDPLAPDGVPLDMRRFFDVASPEGTVVPFDAAWPGDVPPEARAAGAEGPPLGEPPGRAAPGGVPLQPPEYLSSMGGPEERRRLDTAPPDERPPLVRPQAPVPPGFASPQEPVEREPRAPGQQPCTKDAHYVFPLAEQFLFTPQQPEARGKGGGGDENGGAGPLVLAAWTDPCPCVCFCIHFGDFKPAFVDAGRLSGDYFDLFGKDTTSLLGVSGRPPGPVIGTPDGLVQQVRDLLARRDVVGYGAPPGSPPGSEAPADGQGATTFVAAARATRLATPRLLWPELDGTLVSDKPPLVVTPVGPGPGIPGIGMRPLVPASGATLRAAAGTLPAGFSPAPVGGELMGFQARERFAAEEAVR